MDPDFHILLVEDSQADVKIITLQAYWQETALRLPRNRPREGG
jgi:hypothetical protein